MTMRNLGLSIYPDHSEYQKDAEYLELGHKYGFTRIFMSMLEVQGSVEETKAKYQKIIGFGNSLGYQTFIDVSPGLFKKLGIHSAAFVSSKVGEKGPWSVSDGLPTLEMDRKLPIDVQAKQLWATGLIDDVIIGNAYASEAELAALAQVDRYLLTLEVDFVADINPIEETIVKKPLHFWRGDINSLEIRSTMPRVTYRKEGNLAHDNEKER